MFLEAAFFDTIALAGRPSSYGLHTDLASLRARRRRPAGAQGHGACDAPDPRHRRR
ncbi:hypothetical protein ACPA9J_01270 [Pseudomonas aeruginosa]